MVPIRPRNSIQNRLESDIQSRRRGVALTKVSRLQQSRAVTRRRNSHGNASVQEGKEKEEEIAVELQSAMRVSSARLPSPSSKQSQLEPIGEQQGLAARVDDGSAEGSGTGHFSPRARAAHGTDGAPSAGGRAPARVLGKSQSASHLTTATPEMSGFGNSVARFVDAAQWSSRPMAWADTDDIQSPHTRKGFETRNASAGVEAVLVDEDGQLSDAVRTDAASVALDSAREPLPYTAFDGSKLRAREGQGVLEALDGETLTDAIATKSGIDAVTFWPAGHTSEALHASMLPSWCKLRDPSSSSLKAHCDGSQPSSRRISSVLDGEEESKRRSRKSTGTTQVDGVRPAGFQEKKEWSPSGLRRSSSEVQLKVKAGWHVQPENYTDEIANSDPQRTRLKRQNRNAISQESEKTSVYFNQVILRYSQPLQRVPKPTVDTFERICGNKEAELRPSSRSSCGQRRTASDAMAEALTMPSPLCRSPSSPGRRRFTRHCSNASVGVADCFQWNG